MKKKICYLCCAIIFFTTIIGCSASTTESAAGKSADANVVAEKEASDSDITEEENGEISIVKSATPKPTPTTESTPAPTIEPTPEPIIYEGIDMESELPGKEWVATFFDVIEEPVALLINDETNKKVFLENGGDVYYEEGDLFVVYLPDSDLWIRDYNGIRIKDGEQWNNYYNSFSFEKENLDRAKTFSIMIANLKDESAPYIILRYKFQPME